MYKNQEEWSKNQLNNRSIEEKERNGVGDISDNQREIIAVHKEEGNISAVKLDDGSILSKDEAISLTKQGGIKDVNVGRRGSRETLRRNPVEDASQSLSNMPRF